MRPEKISEKACKKIDLDTVLVNEHLKTLEEMVRIDSRSFGVNEFKGDRTVPTDMEEILECAKNYLYVARKRKGILFDVFTCCLNECIDSHSNGNYSTQIIGGASSISA